MLDVETRERTAGSERKRILNAGIAVAAEHGYVETTVEMILQRAGLDRPAFDRHFRGKYDCFLSAWQEINESCMQEMLQAYNSHERWPDRLRAVACEVVESLRGDLSRATFSVEVLAAGDAARARRDMTMRVIASLIDAGRNEMEDPESVPHTTAEALAGSAYGQVYSRVVQGRADELPALVPQLMSAAVMPYLGLEAALAELSRGFDPPARYRRDVAKRTSSPNPTALRAPRGTHPSSRACRRGDTACHGSSSSTTSASGWSRASQRRLPKTATPARRSPTSPGTPLFPAAPSTSISPARTSASSPPTTR